MLLWILACIKTEPVQFVDMNVSELSFLTSQEEIVSPGDTLTIAVQPQDENGVGLSQVSIFFAVSDSEAMEMNGGDLIFVTSAEGSLDGSEYSAIAQTTLTISGDAGAGDYRVWVGQAHPSWNQEAGAFDAFDITVEVDTMTEDEE